MSRQTLPYGVADHKRLKEFGRAVRRIRDEQKITQEELAHRAGLDRTYIGGVERGERNISLINILQVARGLGVLPARFFSDIGGE